MFTYTVKYGDISFSMCAPSSVDILVVNHWAKNKFYEVKLLEQIREYNLEGTYVDGGANLGNHSVFFQTFCKCTRTISIEAVPSIFDVLVENVKTNNTKDVPFTPVNRALAHNTGTKVSWLPLNPRNLGETTMRLTAPNTNNNSIDTITLDEVLFGVNDVVVIKLDIEGCESKALKGATDTLRRCRPLVIAEATTPQRYRDVEAILYNRGYGRVRRVTKEGTFLWQPK